MKKEGKKLSTAELTLRALLRGNPATKKQIAEQLNWKIGTVSKRLSKLAKDSKSDLKREIKGKNQVVYSCPVALEEIVHRCPYELPKKTRKNPFNIEVKDITDYKIGLLGTFYAGGKCDTKLVKNAFKYFQDDKVDAVIVVGGNVSWVDMTRYSKYKPDRAENSEIMINPEKLEYPKSVKKAGRDPKKLLRENRPVYVTFKEKLDMVIDDKLRPLLLDDSGKPIYEGPVYMTFGDIEEELARAHANEVVRKEKNLEIAFSNSVLAELKASKRKAAANIKALDKDISSLEGKASKLEERIDKEYNKVKVNEDKAAELEGQKIELGKALLELEKSNPKLAAKLEKEIKGATEEINEWEDYKSRVIMTNTNDEFIKLAYEQMRGYIIERLESTMPNCKVISTGEAYVKVGNKLGKVIPNANKKSTNPSERLADKLFKSEVTSLHRGESAPDFVVGGGLSPNFTYEPVAVSEPGGDKTVTLIQLPTCLDSESLKDIVKGKVKVGGSNMAKMATMDDLDSGALILEYVQDSKGKEIERKVYLKEEFLKNEEMFKEKGSSNKEAITYEVIWSDQHHKSKYMALTKTKDGLKATYDIAQKIVKEISAPIVRINSVGDECQEMNYDTALEGHPDHLGQTELHYIIEGIRNDKKLSDKEKLKRIDDLRTRNDFRAGIISPGEQLIDFINHTDKDIMKMAIENAEKVGYYGPSIICINGNHNLHTAEGKYITSQLFAFMLKLALDRPEEERICEKSLMQRIMAPMLGTEGIYSGLYGIAPGLSLKASQEEVLNDKDHHLYAEYMRHKVRSKKAGDRMRDQRVRFSERGQHDAKFKGRFYRTISGHDHMGGVTMAKHGIHIRSYCFMERNAFGDKYDYGEPSIGFMFHGEPAGGIHKGPIVFVDVMKDYIDHYAMKSPKLPVEKLFKNSIVPIKKE
ncbi:MAG: hypothetical protein ABIB71_00365 [Candidatus Woesearchaeota archaeon]